MSVLASVSLYMYPRSKRFWLETTYVLYQFPYSASARQLMYLKLGNGPIASNVELSQFGLNYWQEIFFSKISSFSHSHSGMYWKLYQNFEYLGRCDRSLSKSMVHSEIYGNYLQIKWLFFNSSPIFLTHSNQMPK